MILATYYLQQLKALIHVLKSLRKIVARMVIQPKIAVSISHLLIVEAQDLLENNQTLALQLNSLQEVAHLVLNAGHFLDAHGDFFVHRAGHLQQDVDGLAVELEGFL